MDLQRYYYYDNLHEILSGLVAPGANCYSNCYKYDIVLAEVSASISEHLYCLYFEYGVMYMHVHEM
jgi:hypothetical protein